jgi:hypothetical protein
MTSLNIGNSDITTLLTTHDCGATTPRPMLVPVHSRISADIRTSTSTVFSGTAMGATAFEPAFTSGYSTSDSDSAADDFSLRTAQGRLVYICRKLLSLEEQWGDSG